MSDPTQAVQETIRVGMLDTPSVASLLWSGAVLAALVVLAVVFSFAGDAELDPGTPERVV